MAAGPRSSHGVGAVGPENTSVSQSVSLYIKKDNSPPVGFLLGFPGGGESVGELGWVDSIAGRFLYSYSWSGSINYSIGVVSKAAV